MTPASGVGAARVALAAGFWAAGFWTAGLWAATAQAQPAPAAATPTPTSARLLTETELKTIVERRYGGDRTGACLAVAVVDRTTVSTYVCADPARSRVIDDRTAFEIGSVSKTMTAALVAERLATGRLALDDPLQKLLPPEARVASFDGRPITLRHVVTHTSGLESFPSSWRPPRPDNPYANLMPGDVYAALSSGKLSQPPGSTWQYSNLATLTLSLGLARDSGKDFETLITERLFEPLGMTSTYIARKPESVRVATGHLPTRQITSPWDFPVDMAGAGGVRSTLPDMIRYVEAQLDRRHSAITPAIQATHEQLVELGPRRMAMNWLIARLDFGGERRTIHLHGGGTGGFSSIVAFDRARGRGVVVLSDTMLMNTGGLENLALHLIDDRVVLAAPRREVPADRSKLDAMTGRYRLDGGLGIELRQRDGKLFVQADGQPEFEFGHDSMGDFYVLAFDATLRPAAPGEPYAFTWLQGGGAVRGYRIAR